MFLCEKSTEILEKLGINKKEILFWETIFDLNIPRDEQNNRIYNDKNIRCFKNIKKDLALGYTFQEIGAKLGIEKKASSSPSTNSRNISMINPIKTTLNYKKNSETINPKDNLHLIKLIERLMDEKNQMIFDKDYLLEENHKLKLKVQELQKETEEYIDHITKYAAQIEILEDQLTTTIPEIEPQKFNGSWSGKAKLIKVEFNSLDIEIPKERNKSFKITDSPKRIYGNCTVLVSKFKCEEDPLWERCETYHIIYLNPEKLKGELDVEYFVDNVPVAKAIYEITCNKIQDSQDFND